MSRWIDAEWLIKESMPLSFSVQKWVNEVQIMTAPSIDLVRCAECKHQWREHKVCAHEANVVEGVCGKRAEDNDFCSYGERRE